MSRDLPPPLPPQERTVGQLVAETIRLYGRRFWPSLALGAAPAASGVGYATVAAEAQLAWSFTVAAAAQGISFAAGARIAAGLPLAARPLLIAAAVGTLVFVPVPVLTAFLVLPAAAWLGLLGLAVPAAAVEDLGLRAAFRRGVELARADYLHAFGSFAALILVSLATSFALFFLLRGQGEATLAAAGFLAVLVVSPVLYLGGALLYQDQAARLVVHSAPAD